MKVKDEKEALMRAVRCDRMDGEGSLSMAVDIWSRPLLLDYVELSAARTWGSAKTLKKKGTPFRCADMGELRISWRSEGIRGGWRLETEEKCVSREWVEEKMQRQMEVVFSAIAC